MNNILVFFNKIVIQCVLMANKSIEQRASRVIDDQAALKDHIEFCRSNYMVHTSFAGALIDFTNIYLRAKAMHSARKLGESLILANHPLAFEQQSNFQKAEEIIYSGRYHN